MQKSEEDVSGFQTCQGGNIKEASLYQNDKGVLFVLNKHGNIALGRIVDSCPIESGTIQEFI